MSDFFYLLPPHATAIASQIGNRPWLNGAWRCRSAEQTVSLPLRHHRPRNLIFEPPTPLRIRMPMRGMASRPFMTIHPRAKRFATEWQTRVVCWVGI